MPLAHRAGRRRHVLVAGTTDSGQSLPTRLPFIALDAELYQYGVRPTHAFVMKVRASDFSLVYASRFGPRDSPAGAWGVAADGAGNVFVARQRAERRRRCHGERAGVRRPFRFASAFVTRVHERPPISRCPCLRRSRWRAPPVQLTVDAGDAGYAGSVEFRNRGAISHCTLVNGVAQASIGLPAGVHQLAAVVRGSGVWHGNATAPATLVVNQTSATP